MKVQKTPAKIGTLGFIRIEEKGVVTGWVTRRPKTEREVNEANNELEDVAKFLLAEYGKEMQELELWLEELRAPGIIVLADNDEKWLIERQPHITAMDSERWLNGETWTPKTLQAIHTSHAKNVKKGALHKLTKWAKKWGSKNAK